MVQYNTFEFSKHSFFVPMLPYMGSIGTHQGEHWYTSRGALVHNVFTLIN